MFLDPKCGGLNHFVNSINKIDRLVVLTDKLFNYQLSVKTREVVFPSHLISSFVPNCWLMDHKSALLNNPLVFSIWWLVLFDNVECFV